MIQSIKEDFTTEEVHGSDGKKLAREVITTIAKLNSSVTLFEELMASSIGSTNMGRVMNADQQAYIGEQYTLFKEFASRQVALSAKYKDA